MGKFIHPLVLLFLAVLSLVPNTGAFFPRVPGTFFDLLHFPAFAYLSFIVLQQIPLKGEQKWRVFRYVLLALATLALGLELVQPWVGRTADSRDLLLGLLGIMFTSAFYLPLQTRRYQCYFRSIALIPVVLLATIIYTILNPLYQLKLEIKQHHLRLSTKYSAYWRNVNNIALPEPEFSTAQNCVLGYKLRNKYTGLTFEAPFDMDLSWSESISFEVYIPSSTVRMDLRVDGLNSAPLMLLSRTLVAGRNKLSLDFGPTQVSNRTWQHTRKIAVYFRSGSAPENYRICAIQISPNPPVTATPASDARRSDPV